MARLLHGIPSCYYVLSPPPPPLCLYSIFFQRSGYSAACFRRHHVTRWNSCTDDMISCGLCPSKCESPPPCAVFAVCCLLFKQTRDVRRLLSDSLAALLLFATSSVRPRFASCCALSFTLLLPCPRLRPLLLCPSSQAACPLFCCCFFFLCGNLAHLHRLPVYSNNTLPNRAAPHPLQEHVEEGRVLWDQPHWQQDQRGVQEHHHGGSHAALLRRGGGRGRHGESDPL